MRRLGTKLAAAALSLSLLTTGVSAGVKSAAVFTDVTRDSWYYGYLEQLVQCGGINGATDSTFEPEREISVEEYVKTLMAMLYTDEELAPWAETDLGDGVRWSSKYVGAAVSFGLTGDVDLSPAHLDAPITRYEMAELLVLFAESLGQSLTELEGVERAIRDYRAIPEQYQGPVRLAYSAGLLTGRDGGRFDGTASLSRCEAVATVVRLFDETARPAVVIPDAPLYDYSAPVPESEAVDDSFFDDAAFVGNSLGEGFHIYSGLGRGTYYTQTSLSLYNLADEGILSRLSEGSYGKIYVMLGINEIGRGASTLAAKYGDLVDKLRALQPGADIYVQAVLPVCASMMTESQRNYISNSGVQALNSALLTMCTEKQVYYIDLWSLFADENGSLPSGKTWDGVHLNVRPYSDWLSYLRTHTA